MNHQALLAYFDSRYDDMLEIIELLVTQETPSDNKPRLDDFASLLAGRLQLAGASVDIVEQAERGDHVRACFGHERFDDATQQALILCHYDTVWPVGSLATHPFRIEADGKAYGPGIFDMQTSLMLSEFMLHAVNDLNLDLPRPVTILMTSDEEIGSGASRALIEHEGRKSAYTLVLESPLPGGVLKTERKGGGGFIVEVTGRAAHAGVEPERGISAVHELAHQTLAIQALTDWDKGTTVSVNVVEGGTAGNVIPAFARAQVDLRAWTLDEIRRVEASMSSLEPVLPGAQLAVSGGGNRPPLEHAVTGELFEKAQVIGKKLGLDLEEGSTGGGSDASWTGALGIPTLDGLGVPGHGAHADHEHIEVDQIASRAALLTAMLMEL